MRALIPRFGGLPVSVVNPTDNPPGIDLLREQAIPLADVPKLPWIPRRSGRRLHVATVHRWCRRGVRGTRLQSVRLGGIRVPTEAALLRFFGALSGDAVSQPSSARRES